MAVACQLLLANKEPTSERYNQKGVTTERKALIIPRVNQKRQIQGISLIKHFWVRNIVLYPLPKVQLLPD